MSYSFVTDRKKNQFLFALTQELQYISSSSLVISQLFVTLWTAAHQASLSITNSRSLLKVMSNSLWPHEPQHARPLCPSPTPRVYSDSCPLSQWCHPTISSSVVPFSCFQSFPASGLFKWVSSSHQVAKVLEFQLQHQSFQWIFRTVFL